MDSITKTLDAIKNASSGSTSSGGTSTSGGNGYNSGSNYSGRETAFTWSDGSTTYSPSTNYLDAQKEGGKQGVNLVSAVTYDKGGPTVSSGNGFTDQTYSNSQQTGTYYDQALAREKQALQGINNTQQPDIPVQPLPSIQQQLQPQPITQTIPDYSSMFSSALNGMQNQNNSFMQSITDKLNSYKNSGGTNTVSENNYVNDTLGRKSGTGAYIKSATNSSNAISRYLAGDVFKNRAK